MIKMKSQVDVALLIGSIVIPSAALLGALIFAFTLLGPLTDMAKLAAVISHDTITLADIAYSVPEDIEIHYKPPSLCKFADLKNPNAGCTSKPIKCSSITDRTNCIDLYGCKWDGDENSGSCGEDTSTVSGGYGYYKNTTCTPSFDDNGNLKTDCCKGITDENTCLGENACSWQDPYINGISCLNGAMNMSRFDIRLNKENTTLLNGTENFPTNTEVYFPAVIDKKYFDTPTPGDVSILTIPYPGYANILDKGFTKDVEITINKEGEYLSIKKVRDGVYDTIGEKNYRDGGPLEDVASLVKDAIKSRENKTGRLFLPQFYFTNFSEEYNVDHWIAKACLNRVAQSPDNVTDISKQTNYTIYCFDFQQLNKTTDDNNKIIFDDSFNTFSNYTINRAYTVHVNLTCMCDSCDQADTYKCGDVSSSVPWYYAKVYLEEQS